MRLNENTVIVSDKVVLVPYQRHHVERYHSWMADPWLQEMTASEPLSIEEEYAMQQSWQQDEAKLTFIVCDRSVRTSLAGSVESMVGDVNLFMNANNEPHSAEVILTIS